MFTCNTCFSEKTDSEFYYTKRKNGQTYRVKRCITCCKKAGSKSHEAKIRRINPDIDKKRLHKKSISEARKKGRKHFYPLLPCPKGHLSKRLVSTQQCCRCLAGRRAEKRGHKISTRKINRYKRQVARNLGKTRFSGVLECPRGHKGARLVSTGQCCECLSMRHKQGEKQKSKTSALSKRKSNSKRRSRAGRVKQRKYQSEVLNSRREYKISRFMYGCIRRTMNEKDAGPRLSSHKKLGYTKHDLMQRIELNFCDGMSWSNYGEWHIDHTIPISKFTKKGESRPSIINALCNLRPMWAYENLSKGGFRQPSVCG